MKHSGTGTRNLAMNSDPKLYLDVETVLNPENKTKKQRDVLACTGIKNVGRSHICAHLCCAHFCDVFNRMFVVFALSKVEKPTPGETLFLGCSLLLHCPICRSQLPASGHADMLFTSFLDGVHCYPVL